MKQRTIECPHCGYEYHPSEIFLPNYLIGKPKEISRDIYGNILAYGGIEQDLTEEYVCDKCGARFKVTARLDFTVEEDKFKSFADDYSAPIYKDRVKLDEQ